MFGGKHPEGGTARGVTLLLLVADGRLGYRVLRCAAAVEGVERILVLAGLGGSRFPARDLKASRCCAEIVTMSWPFGDPRSVEEVNAVAARCVNAIIAPADFMAARFLATSAPRLAVQCVPMPSLHALDLLGQKDMFAAFCEKADLPHPSSTVAANFEEARALAARRAPSSPLVLKPIVGGGSMGVQVVTADQPNWPSLDYCPVLVQDYVPGVDVCASAFCEEGQVVAFQAYKYETRRLFGKSLFGKTLRTAVEFFDASALEALVAEVAVRSDLNGIVNFDARLTPDGELILIECNPRPWYTINLTMIAGRNFASLWFDEPRRRTSLSTVAGSVALFPSSVLSGRGLALSHLRYLLSDPWYLCSVEFSYLIRDWCDLALSLGRRLRRRRKPSL